MKKILVGLFLAAIALVFTACTNLSGNDGMAKVEGNVVYLQRIALPENAKITVTLADVSLADAPWEVISSQSFISDGKQVPIPFSLEYSPSEIKQGHTYTVSARIEVAGQLMFINDTAHPVITDENKTTELDVMLVHAAR